MGFHKCFSKETMFVGCTMIAIGVWMAVDNPFSAFQSMLEEMDIDMWKAAVYTIISLGCVVFLMGFLGYCGASCENRCMLISYVTLMDLIVIVEIVVVILVVILRDDINIFLLDNMESQVHEKYINETEGGLSSAWNHMQVDLECCGAENYTDYKDSNFHEEFYKPVPYTCCVMTEKKGWQVRNQTVCMNEAQYYNLTEGAHFFYTQGCYNKLINGIKDHSVIVFGTLGAVVGIQLIGLLFACCMILSMKKTGRYKRI